MLDSARTAWLALLVVSGHAFMQPSARSQPLRAAADGGDDIFSRHAFMQPPARGRPLRAAADDISMPMSTNAMVYAAARSVRAAVAAGETRQTVEMFVPLLPTVKPEDLDPWPGGLKQMCTVALPIARDLLKGAVVGGGAIEERVLSADDGVVQLYCQGETPKDDAMMIVFAGSETFDDLVDVEQAVGPRPLLLFNPQFSTPADLGLFKRGAAKTKSFFGSAAKLADKFPTTYCCAELSVRSEDVRLVHEYDRGWRAFYVDDAEFDGQNMITEGTPLPLHEDPLDARPDYASLETLVRKKLKLPVYVRRMREAGDDGPRFLR